MTYYSDAYSRLAGVADGGEAAPGQFGEWAFAAQTDAEAVELVSGEPARVMSVTLQPGDWDVFGSVRTLGTSTNLTDIALWITDEPGSLPSFESFAFTRFNLGVQGQSGADTQFKLITGPARISTAEPVPVALGCMVAWMTGTVQAAGALRARRMR